MTSGVFTGPFGDPDEKYISPFGDPNTDHDSPDSACLARSAYDDPTLATIQEYVDMAHIAIESKRPQVALFLVRHAVELLLKACIRTDRHEGELEALQKALKWHDLKSLLRVLKRQDDDLWTGTSWSQPKIRDSSATSTALIRTALTAGTP
jgi:hypothetical protein